MDHYTLGLTPMGGVGVMAGICATLMGAAYIHVKATVDLERGEDTRWSRLFKHKLSPLRYIYNTLSEPEGRITDAESYQRVLSGIRNREAERPFREAVDKHVENYRSLIAGRAPVDEITHMVQTGVTDMYRSFPEADQELPQAAFQTPDKTN